MSLLEIKDLTKSFFGAHALRGASFNAEQGRITGLIGPNGAGKTTLFNVVSGVMRADGGTVLFDGRNITNLRPDEITRAGLVRTFQIARGFPRLTVLENLMLYAPGNPGETLRRRHLARLGRPVPARPPSARRPCRSPQRLRPDAGSSTLRIRSLRRAEKAAGNRPGHHGEAEDDPARRAGRRRQPEPDQDHRRAISASLPRRAPASSSSSTT